MGGVTGRSSPSPGVEDLLLNEAPGADEILLQTQRRSESLRRWFTRPAPLVRSRAEERRSSAAEGGGMRGALNAAARYLVRAATPATHPSHRERPPPTLRSSPAAILAIPATL